MSIYKQMLWVSGTSDGNQQNGIDAYLFDVLP